MKPTFIQPCFIRKNTPDLRRKLEELGYDLLFSARNGYGEGLCVRHDFATSVQCEFDGIDCGTDEALFLAVAALREDSDYMQWFVTDEEHHWVNQGMYMPKGSFIQSFVKDFPKDNSHKASVEELIEHFKKD